MQNNPVVHRSVCLLLVVAACSAASAQTSVKPVTKDELHQQIEALKPSPGTAARRTPSGVVEPARAEVRNAAGSAALFGEGRAERLDRPEKSEKRSKGPTEIVALEATFDQKAHIAIFIGEVVVTDPEFTVQADRLTAYLKHDDHPASEVVPGRLSAVPPGVKPPGKPPKSGGLEKAIAEADPGKVVTVIQEKNEADGSLSRSVGHGRKVHFDSVTGDITLTGRPDVQQGINTCVAMDDSTIMILNREGHMRVTGPHKTVIKDQGDLSK